MCVCFLSSKCVRSQRTRIKNPVWLSDEDKTPLLQDFDLFFKLFCAPRKSFKMDAFVKNQNTGSFHLMTSLCNFRTPASICWQQLHPSVTQDSRFQLSHQKTLTKKILQAGNARSCLVPFSTSRGRTSVDQYWSKVCGVIFEIIR